MTSLIEVNNLKKYFPVRRGLFGTGGTVHAVEDVSFSIASGEVLGLVGEFGSVRRRSVDFCCDSSSRRRGRSDSKGPN